MKTVDLRTYFNSHCRFRMKSGKEVYGVIWEVNKNTFSQYYFASVYDHERYTHALATGEDIDLQKLPVDITEIVHAERLVS